MKQVDVERLRQKLEFQRHEAQQFLRRMEQEVQSLDTEATQDTADRCVISLSKKLLRARATSEERFCI